MRLVCHERGTGARGDRPGHYQPLPADWTGHSVGPWYCGGGCRLGTDGRGSAPDLICVFDVESGEPVTTEALRYGYRVEVIGIPCDPRFRSPEGLKLVGARYFGYDFDFIPVEERLFAG
jgi:hypothetical protein